jgi:hypothetical protein
MKLKLEIKIGSASTFSELGSQPLQAVPYALYANNAKEVESSPSALDDDPIFVVKNKLGQIVFAVYQTGVEVFVDDSQTPIKRAKGGFAVGGLSGTKESVEYFRVTPDSTRVWVKEPLEKRAKGGFAVGGLSGTKSTSNYIDLTAKNYLIGYNAGKSLTTGLYNSFIGYQSGQSTMGGTSNIFVGYQAGLHNIDGDYNAFIGYTSGFNNTDGSHNVFVGYESGLNNTNGISNNFIGKGAGYSNKKGNNNIFIGNDAGWSNEGSSGNVYIGSEAGRNSLENGNTFIGHFAGQNIEAGANNVFIGCLSSSGRLKGSGNLILGAYSNFSGGKGDNNTILGFGAGYESSGYGNVFLGYNAGYSEIGSNKLYISNSSSDSSEALVYGEFDNKLLTINAKVGIGRIAAVNSLEVEGEASKTTATAWLANSDRRIKTDILDIDNAFETILKLRPVKFKYTNEYKAKHPIVKDKYYYNFIAQEFQEVFPESVNGSGEYIDGTKEEILQLDSYNAQIVSIKAVQELILANQKQQKEVQELILENQQQQKEIEELKQKNKEIETLKAELEALKKLIQSK